MTKSPPLPERPACHSWPLPPMPQPNCRWRSLSQWQANRCAICEKQIPESPQDCHRLYEDHDHATGDTRGFLCPRCNTMEGRSQLPVFEMYRALPPTKLLGIWVRHGEDEHPLVLEALALWKSSENGRMVLHERHLRREVKRELQLKAIDAGWGMSDYLSLVSTGTPVPHEGAVGVSLEAVEDLLKSIPVGGAYPRTLALRGLRNAGRLIVIDELRLLLRDQPDGESLRGRLMSRLAHLEASGRQGLADAA